MEEAYLLFLDLLTPVIQLKWIDLDKAQLDQPKPPVQYPAAILVVEYPDIEDLGGNVQSCDVMVTIRLAFNYVGDTSNTTPEIIRSQSLEYLRTVQAVYKAVQGKSGNGFAKFKRRAVLDEVRDDGLKVIRMPFASKRIDTSAA